MRKFDIMKHYFFVLFVTFVFLASCTPAKYTVTKERGKNIPITESISQKTDIDNFISPYRERIKAEMSTVLAENARDLVKDRKTTLLNTGISNFMADATFEMVSEAYKKRTGKEVDFVMLNWGGIRSDLPKGTITMESAFNLMLFENEVIVLTMPGTKVKELADYLIQHHLPHPLSKQVSLQITKDGKITHFTINGQPFDPNKTYVVVTSDYLYNGGDEMYFFKGALDADKIGYKLRNVLIDYFKKIDVLNATEDHRFEYKP